MTFIKNFFKSGRAADLKVKQVLFFLFIFTISQSIIIRKFLIDLTALNNTFIDLK